MPTTTVKGHAGKMVLGDIHGKRIICLAGRVHGYEGISSHHSSLILGYEMYELNFTARLLALLGVKLLVATNAAGGSQPGMYPGCLMIITDHINFYRRNPLAGNAHGHSP
jgi:purine-nucleoside phosphorylase